MNSIQRNQGGVMLLEAMIGILIFSLGVLALVAMQAVSISNVSNARYRSEAAFLANEILSQAWVDRGASRRQHRELSLARAATRRSTDWVTKVNQPAARVRHLPADDHPGGDPRACPPRGTQLDGHRSSGRRPTRSSPSNHVAIGFVSEASEH